MEASTIFKMEAHFGRTSLLIIRDKNINQRFIYQRVHSNIFVVPDRFDSWESIVLIIKLIGLHKIAKDSRFYEIDIERALNSKEGQFFAKLTKLYETVEAS